MTAFADRPDSQKPTTSSVRSQSKEPWVSPSIEDLDVADFTQGMAGIGMDGGFGTTLS